MLTPDEEEWFAKLTPELDKNWHILSKWEKSFIEDIISKHATYGMYLNLSKKQWEIIAQISEKVGL